MAQVKTRRYINSDKLATLNNMGKFARLGKKNFFGVYALYCVLCVAKTVELKINHIYFYLF